MTLIETHPFGEASQCRRGEDREQEVPGDAIPRCAHEDECNRGVVCEQREANATKRTRRDKEADEGERIEHPHVRGLARSRRPSRGSSRRPDGRSSRRHSAARATARTEPRASPCRRDGRPSTRERDSRRTSSRDTHPGAASSYGPCSSLHALGFLRRDDGRACGGRGGCSSRRYRSTGQRKASRTCAGCSPSTSHARRS